MSLPESIESNISFQQYWLILKRRWLPATTVCGFVFILTAIGLLLRNPSYLAEGKLLFRKVSTTSSLTGLGREIGEITPLQELSNPVDTEAEVIRSAPIVQETIERLDLKDDRGKTLSIKKLLTNLKVSNIKGTNVLRVAYIDKNPEQAAAVVNALMAVYLQKNFLNNRNETATARQFIQQQLPQADARLRQTELQLRQFKEKNNVVDLGEEAKSALAMVADLQRQVNNARSGLADAQAQSGLIRKQLGIDLQNAGTETSLSQLPAVQDVLKDIQQLESQLVIEQSRFQQDAPSVVSLKQKKKDLEKLLQQRLAKVFGKRSASVNTNILQNSEFDQKLTGDFVAAEARRLGLSSQLAALSKLQSTYNKRLVSLPKLEQKQRELERQIQASQATYSLLLQKFQEIRIAENQNIGNARIIASALVPDEPVTPRQFALLAAALLGVIASGVTVYALEVTDKSIRGNDARKIFGYTLLGIIPALKKSEKFSLLRDRSLERDTPEILVKDSPQSPFSQAYQTLQANLKVLNSDRQLKAITIASSVPKEGKSTVAANLAVTVAQMGRKVLLVDADMHRPLQHKIWELPNHLGLSNIIVGQTEPKTAIKKITANLHVLTAGVTPPNPVALLDSPRMASLVNIFSANYDFTIIDTPALCAAADAAILGRMTDGVLLVVRPGVVDTTSAQHVKEFLEQSGQHVLGLVVNGFNPDRDQYSYYYPYSQSEPEDSKTPVENSFPLLTHRKE